MFIYHSNQGTQLFTAPLEADIFEPVALYSEKPQFGLLSSSLLASNAHRLVQNHEVTEKDGFSCAQKQQFCDDTTPLVFEFSTTFLLDAMYEPGKHEGNTCRYNKNTGYVIFSAMGSFFIPMVVMVYVYVKISCVVAQRHDQLAHIDTAHPRVSEEEHSNL
ncbi:hypothetical protein NQ318_009438 [Aromia moschata]|uniref:Uncharacterized protein n=1 Tax=Aromia moschata TaxID=1265417 RepID=A0AAV8Z7E1_9CUCU|nr:hypothetical protein NQ318_009438 [Aromia moschata]